MTFANGKTLDREFRVGNIVWVEAQTHIGENTEETDTHVLIIELKEPPQALLSVVKALAEPR